MRTKRIVAFLLAACFFLPGAASLRAEAAQTIRVGWMPHPGGSEVHDGVYSGYNYDYLMEIAKYTGWQYIFVEGDFSACAAMLEAGEVDIVGSLFYTEERAQVFDFPQLEYGHTYTTLFTGQNSPIQPYDFDRFDGMRVGVISDASNKEYLAEFAANNGFTYTTVDYQDTDTLVRAVLDGEVDAGILGAYTPERGARVLAEFAPLPYYFATTKGNREVLVGLSRALNQIRIDNPYLEQELYEKNFCAPLNLELSNAELALVERSKTSPIPIGLITSSAPICYWDEETQTYAGVFTEMLHTVSERTGLRFAMVNLQLEKNPPVAWLKSGYPDLVVGILWTQAFAQDKTLVLSDTLIEDALVLVGRKGDDFTDNPAERIIAVPVGFQVAFAYVEEQFPQHNVISRDTALDCMDAVVAGEADATLYMRSSINYILQNPHYEKLEIIPAFTRDVSTRIAGRADDGAVLMSIVNKGLAMITAEERNNMIINYTIMNPYRLTPGDVLYKYWIPISVIILLLAVVIAVLLRLNVIRRRSAEKLQAAYEQERAALHLAEKASMAKGAFMSRMSHEIRTPLNAVIGYNAMARSEMAEAGTEAELRQANMKIMDCLTKSDIASRHLLTIINDVLDMSAIESGKIQVVHERFDFKSLITALTILFYSQAKAKEVDFEVVFDTLTEEWFLGDQMRVSQILTNLLSNAVKFTPAGGSIRLTIRQPEADVNAAHIHFEVEDTGIGMDEEFLAHIWTPFEQADASISRRFGGTGLGLSITKNLVDLMGGTISVESQVGVGSTFSVDITFGRTTQPQPASYDFSSINALVVDDERSNCEYLKLLFDRFGVRCTTALSGYEAFTAIRKANAAGDNYTLCLVDLHMPEMDGLETIRQIREIAGNEVPVIIVTAYDYTGVENEARAMGVSLFASKPVFQSTLFDLLVNASGKSAAAMERQSAAVDFSGARVLLAEDNKMNMEVAKSILAAAGLTVDCAWNGKEAVANFLSAPPGTYKAIIMDVQMPEMDGHEATRMIRASSHAEAATIPIIAMTADAFAENVSAALESGMDDHIAKPIDTDVLFATLRKYMSE